MGIYNGWPNIKITNIACLKNNYKYKYNNYNPNNNYKLTKNNTKYKNNNKMLNNYCKDHKNKIKYLIISNRQYSNIKRQIISRMRI